MSEKLAAFTTLYNEKAEADVVSATEWVAKSEEKLNRAVELWNAVKTETEKLGIAEKFTAAFPKPGGKVIVTDGVNPNPNYMALFSYGEPLESSVRELTKLKNAESKLQSAKNSLALASTLVSRKPEDHLAILGSALVGVLAEASALGANSLDDLLKSVFSNYEDFESVVMTEIDGVDAPSTINTSPQAYEALKEKFESGELTKKVEETSATTSPINESVPGTEMTQTSPLNPEVEAVPETETGVTNTSAVTGAPVQLPPETPALPTEGGVTVNVEATQPTLPVEKETISSEITQSQVQTVPTEPATSPAGTPSSPINETITGQQMSPNLEMLASWGINVNDPNVLSLLNTQTLEKSDVSSSAAIINEPGKENQTSTQSVESKQTELTASNNVINEQTNIQTLPGKSGSPSSPNLEMLKSWGIDVTSKKVLDVLNEETLKGSTQNLSEKESNLVTTEQNKELNITKDQMQMPSSPITGSGSTNLGTSQQNTPSPGVTLTPETVTGSEPSPETGTGTNQTNEPAPGQTTGAGGPPSAPSIGNLSELEARLARIEFLLSGPLEVKIIE